MERSSDYIMRLAGYVHFQLRSSTSEIGNVYYVCLSSWHFVKFTHIEVWKERYLRCG